MSEYIVDRLGQLGDGIIDTPNGEIFAPFTLPGEHIEGNVENGRVNSPKIIKPVSDRIKPACKHFKSCGGCSLQHASDTVISDWKIRKTQDALSQVNLHPEFRPIINSKAGSRRRATFAAKRTKKGALVGFHGRASDVIIEISECPISDPILLSGMPAFSQFAILGSSRKAVLRISATVSGNSLDVKIDNGKKLSATEISKFAQICNQFKILRLMWNDDVIAQSNPPSQKMGLADVIPPSGAFLQATKSGEAALIKTVLEIIGPSKRVVDLFAGCGTFALPISSKATVHALEGDASMIAALDSGWRAAGGLHDIKSETRDLFRRPLMPDEFKKIDAIVIDPPRAGAVSQVVEIAKANVGRIAFVSCNPATFARDASILCNNGYNLDWVQVIDQFLWNPHIELVAQFTK
ncbi:class I SAM-dependent RNA methyltransferase [Amylibacter sp.]|nr:class I SAM-dependent RNA methyltransferase [Amylibacter sp.]MDC1264878.1 class I SAM-dependent RNA methyltransferase [Amylibacter sp.]